MRIALDVSSAARPEATGVAMYIRRMVEAFGRVGKDHQITLVNRLSRWKNRGSIVRPPTPAIRAKWIQEPFHPFFGRKIDVFHGMDARLPGPWMKAKLVVTIHDVFSALQSKEFATEDFRKLKAKRYQDIVDRADRIIVVSEACKKDVLKTLEPDPDRVRVVYEAAGPEFHAKPEREIEIVREAYGLDRPYLLYIGTINKRKNLPTMIQAFMRAHEKLNAAPALVIAGRIGYGGDDIRRAINDAGGADHVRLIGYVPDEDVPALFSGARGLLFATLYEGFGIPAVEAMACGCPVIGGNRGSVPEIVNDAGLLADPTDVEDIATQIRRLFCDQDLHDTLTARGLLRAQDFSWDIAAEQCLKIYEELC